MKLRLIALLLAFTMVLGLFTGCKKNEDFEFDAPAVEDTVEKDEGSEEKEEEPEKEDEKEEQKEDEKEEEKKPASEDKEQEKDNKEDKEETPDQQKEPEKEPEKEEEPQKTPEAGSLTNLFEVAHKNVGINVKGKDEKDSGYSIAKAIKVSEGDTLTFGPVSSAQVVMGFAYNSSNKPLERINGSNLKEEDTFEYGMKIYTYTVPKGATEVRMNVSSVVKDQFMLTKNCPFKLKEYTQVTQVPDNFVEDPLKDKRGLFVGDSICSANRDTIGGIRGWAQRVANDTGLIAVNGGKSGASVSNTRLGGAGTILMQLEKVKTEDYDYVVLHGGVNDAWDKEDVGTMSEEFDPMFFDCDTFAGGLETLFYNAIQMFGDKAAIGYLINFKAPSCTKGYISDMTAYNEVAKKICDKWGITYFDMYNHEEITAELKFTTTTHTTDYIHPNASGYDILAPYIEDYMRNMTACPQKSFDQTDEKE